MKMRHYIWLALVVMSLGACTEYRKVLKSADMQYKYDTALKYYKAGKYTKAYPLLEELYIVYRGTDKGERIAYYQAKCDFKQNDFILAAHRFEQFYQNYPRSEFAEESRFLSAYCNYKLSPKWSLDQMETNRAIRALQLFAIAYPESGRIDSCNQLLDELRYKLEYKEYRAAKLFFKMENYSASKVAFANFNASYPMSTFREETWYLWFESSYLLAINSVEEKKKERLEAAKEAYITFVDRFQTSKYLKQAEAHFEKIQAELEKTVI